VKLRNFITGQLLSLKEAQVKLSKESEEAGTCLKFVSNS